MAIPDYQSIMQPLLELVGRASEIKLADTLDPLTTHLGVGVSTERQFEIKKVDLDYFLEG